MHFSLDKRRLIWYNMGIKTKKRVQSDMKDKVDMKLNNVFELANGMEEEYVNEPYEMKVESGKNILVG